MEKKPQADKQDAEAPKQRVKRKRRRFGFAAIFSLAVAGLVFFVLSLALTGRTLPVPEVLRAKLEDSLNAQLEGAPLRLGSMEFGIDRQGMMQVLMNNIQLADQSGGAVAQLNWLGAELSMKRVLRREFAAEKIFLTGAQITIRRTASGQFTLAAGPSISGQEKSVTEVLARIDREMTVGAVSSLEEVVAGGIVLTLEDARSGRIWQATNASVTLRKTGDALTLSVTSDVFNGTDDLAGLQVSLTRSRATEHVQLGVTVEDMPAADIALQSPVLSWLGVLDAPISGSVRTELDEVGALASFAGTLNIAEGALQPTEATPPVAFDGAKAYFTFDPARQRIDFSEVSVVARQGAGVATGHTYLAEFEGAWPAAFLGQFRFEDLEYTGGDTFDGPLTLSDVFADIRVRLDPFEVTLGQIAIDNEGVPISATGRIATDQSGWHVAIDATTPEIDADRVMQFWPRLVSPISRGWLSDNLSEGRLINPALGVRYDSGSEPDAVMSFNFTDGLARFLPEMPPLEEASGRALLHDRRFSLFLETGEIASDIGGTIDAGGSTFTVLDTRPKPSWGEIGVAAKGPLTAVLDVLNNPPLQLMDRANRSVEIAEALVAGRATILLPLQDEIDAEEVTYDVDALLQNVTSDVLVPERVLTSPALRLMANPDLISVSGPALLDGVPLAANWRQPLGEASSEGGEISGRVTLSSDTVAVFDLPLPEGFLRGEGQADYTLQLPADPDIAPELELRSDLYGLGMSLDAVGWSKPLEERGDLQISARLGDVPEIDSLALRTRDLSFEGNLDLSESGDFERARFESLELGSWLNAVVDVTPSPDGGAPTISVLGGTLDLRQLELGPTQGRSGPATASPINLQLDRLTVSDGIEFAPLRGRIEIGARGISGSFEARLNGQTPVRGTLSPANAGTAIRITSASAAGVLRDAGLTPNARGGTLDLVLTPVAGAPSGTFDGEFLIEDVRLRDAPVMAELLDAVSVVGLLDQLSGPGIRFETIDGQFRLNRRQIRLRQAAAVGPSMGISADGIYDLQARQIDFRGVVSPVYFLNGIGSILTRRGEGLFGFNYRMSGPAADPTVRVNPLSILTPGAFRQIFRRAPPGG